MINTTTALKIHGIKFPRAICEWHGHTVYGGQLSLQVGSSFHVSTLCGQLTGKRTARAHVSGARLRF